MNIYDVLRKHLLEQQIAVNGPANDMEVNDFEEKHGVTLPRDFREYVSVMNGMSDGETDEYLFHLFPLEEFRVAPPHPNAPTANRELIFADYSLDAHVYLMQLGGHPEEECPVFASDGTNKRLLADSFAGFVQKYITDPRSVAYCWK